MFSRMRRIFSNFLSRSRRINNEPLNKVSLIVLIVIDIFILINVFIGLNDISQWHISPGAAYPCYSEWSKYQTQTNEDKNYQIIQRSLQNDFINNQSNLKQYQQGAEGRLGNLSKICLNYAQTKDLLNNSENQQTIKSIEQKEDKISFGETNNRKIRKQYDSTLLEKIAGQTRERSINSVGAEKAKQELERNNQEISTLKKEITNLKNQLVSKPESANFLALLQNNQQFSAVKKSYEQAEFWYPSLQFAFQALFLLPLILIALLAYSFAQRKRYGLIALISWHLLVIFFIPLLFKVFEFLQVGVIFKFIFDIAKVLFGGLLFLVSYLYILLIPIIGFGIIKLFQKIVFNPKIQTAKRVQQSSCIKCAKKIRPLDSHCPHCGYYQYVECQNCNQLTYKHLPYCKDCGASQSTNL